MDIQSSEKDKLIILIKAITDLEEEPESYAFFVQVNVLFRWINANKENELLYANENVPQFVKQSIDRFGIENARNKQKGLEEKYLKSIAFPKSISRRLAWVVAASLILVIGGTALWITRNAKNNQVEIDSFATSTKNIVPGTSKATLKLSNGKIIELDTVGSGTLVSLDGITIEKSKNGQLIYNISNVTKTSGSVLTSGTNVVTTPRGGQYQIILPDGTNVWLNAASSLEFPIVFNNSARAVKLTGEAFFEVKKDVTAPFNVTVNDVKVDVLGTNFNIMAYLEESRIETTLVDGSVRVTRISEPTSATKSEILNNKPVVLTPGLQAQITRSQSFSPIIVKSANIDDVIAWKNNDFSFNHTALSTLLHQMSRWYNVEIEYKGNNPSESYSGMVKRSKKLVDILNILKQQGITYSYEGGKVILR